MKAPISAHLLCVGCPDRRGQIVVVQPAHEISVPAPTVDGNSPEYWQGDLLKVDTSTRLANFDERASILIFQ